MRIIHLSAECYPVAKVGGLADVVGSLPKYQCRNGVVSQVCMPYYNNQFTTSNKFKTIYKSVLNLGDTSYKYRVVSLKNNHLKFDLFLIDIPDLLYTNYVYSNDDTERFLAFQIAFLDWILTLEKKPSIIHCHDHHVGLIPFMMTKSYQYDSIKYIPTVLTIHNAQYQGWFSHDKVHLIPKFNNDHVGLLDWGDCINPLAAAIKCAWRVTTVSPNYMEELKHEANGLEYLLSHESGKCVGILNGIDVDVWNSETDDYLIKNYKASSILSGKNANKKYLCQQYHLDIDKPLVAFIGRLVGEKGADLLPEVFREILQKNNVSVLLLGSGYDKIEKALTELKINFIGSYDTVIGYNEQLSHIIYAGADFLLMPSRVEPCGLNQMYALRYGTIPIVRNIGGLKDTVIDISESDGFGICVDIVSVSEISKAVDRAVALFKNKKLLKKIKSKIMKIDHSWDTSAAKYINLYKSLNY